VRPRLFAALVAVCLLALVAAACSSSSAATTMTLTPVNGGTLTVGIDQAPTGCNPNTAAGATWANQLILEPVLPSTFIVNDQGQEVGNAALVNSAEVQSVKPQTVVYTLSPTATWSDGTPISADDFVYAWQQQRVATDAATTAGYRDIRSVTGSNHGHTVTVVFTTHFGDWRMLFNDLLPAHVMDRTGWDPPCTTVDPAIDLSGGPFMIAAVHPDEVDLVPNPHWQGQQQPPLAHLDIKIAHSSAQLAQWLATGTAQVVEPTTITSTVLAQMDALPGASTNVLPSSTFVQLEFSATSPVTGTTALRQAVAYAVDRQALVNAAVGWADSGIVPAASHLYSQTDGGYPRIGVAAGMPNSLDDGNVTTTTSGKVSATANAAFPATAELDQTTRLLTAAGYTPGVGGAWTDVTGVPVTLRLAIDEGDHWVSDSAPVLESQLRTAGFAVQPVPELSAAAAGEAMANGGADLALLPMTSPNTTFPSQATAWYSTLLGPPGTGGSQDWSNYSSPSLDTLLNKAGTQLSPETASTYYQQADTLLWSQMVALPLFNEPDVIGIQNTVSGAGPNPYGSGLLWFPSTWQLQKLQPTTSTTG
jgi:peptide/nickel transport system substrate-binding protein